MAKFRNIDPSPPGHKRSFGTLLRWKLGLYPPGEEKMRSPGAALVPTVPNDGVTLRGAPRPALTWIGHATYLVQLGGRSVLTDPILSPRIVLIPRNVPPGLTYEALPAIDIVTVSHNHMDHLDAPTLRRLGSDVTYVVPTGLGRWFTAAGLPKVIELGWWETTRVLGLDVSLVPAQHWSRRGPLDEDQTLWGGFVIAEPGGPRVYHAGDTAYFSGFAEIGKRLGTLDAALLPIGAYEPRWFMKAQHMNPADAVQAFVDLRARRFCAMHWGTFKLTDEPLDAPPRVLADLWHERSLHESALAIPAIGQTLYLDEP